MLHGNVKCPKTCKTIPRTDSYLKYFGKNNKQEKWIRQIKKSIFVSFEVS